MTNVDVLCDSRVTTTREPDENDSWDRGNTCTYWGTPYIKLSKSDNADLFVPFDVVPGKEYYLLTLIYSTGDTFGQDEDARLEEIGLYEDVTIAEENTRRINEPPDKKLMLLTMDGKGEYEVYRAWNGYFESLSSVNITTLTLD